MEATPLDDTDFKKTQKLTWLAKTNQAALTPITCMHYDHIISKPVLSKDDDFKDYINTDSKVCITGSRITSIEKPFNFAISV